MDPCTRVPKPRQHDPSPPPLHPPSPRSIPTTSNDRIYCKVLGQGAVHGAFAGYTGFCTGLVNTHYVVLPIETIIQAPRKVNPTGR